MGLLINSLPYYLETEIANLCLQKRYFLKKLFLNRHALLNDRKKLAKKIHKSIGNGEYRHAPVKKVAFIHNGKRRIIYQLSFIDRVISGAVHKIIAGKLDSFYQPGIHSYRKAFSRITAIKQLLTYIKAYRYNCEDIKNRGLYVLRFDIKKYGESIPVHERSSIWQSLENIFAGDAYELGFDAHDYRLLSQLIKPHVIDKNSLKYNTHGIIDGSPTNVILLNLYLKPLDLYLHQVPNSFYARYGDDLVFITRSYETMKDIEPKLSQILNNLELEVNPKKRALFYFNNAGRADKNGLKGCHKLDFLGLSINFNGEIEMKPEKMSQILGLIKSRIRNISSSFINTESRNIEINAPIICNAINNSFDSKSIFFIEGSDVLNLISSKQQLRQLDYILARLVASNLSGVKSVKALRYIPYKKIRTVWGLESLSYKHRKHLAN